ncbi:MAG: hypothetical protein WAM02_09725 [Candidatus Cybelea sp.]
MLAYWPEIHNYPWPSFRGSDPVLHSFGTGTGDGQNPYAGLINVNGTL